MAAACCTSRSRRRHAPVVLLHQDVAERVGDGEGAQGADRVDEQRVGTVEGVDEPAAVRGPGPAPRLHGAARLEGQLVEGPLPGVLGDPALVHQAQQVAVGADVVEAVIVHADVGEVRRHPLHACSACPISRNSFVPGGVELEERRAVLEALRPLGPAARGPCAAHGEDGRALRRRRRSARWRGSCGRTAPTSFGSSPQGCSASGRLVRALGAILTTQCTQCPV